MKLFPYVSALLLACTPLIFVHPVRITGNSMEPALKDGQVLLALWPWCSGKPDLGEIRILNSPEGTVIKRVLAMPGQELEQRNGYLIRAGQPVEEAYVLYREIRNDGPWEARDGYLLLGDNRRVSRDCRLWGPMQRAAVRGRVLY
jgi:signal peptidase I